MGKAMHVFVSQDKMVGSDFEKGLAALDAAVRAETKTMLAQPSLTEH